jgi:hypothetical protein
MAPFWVFMGTVPGAAGQPDYTYDGNDKRIPVLFSRTYRKKFYDETVAANITNTDVEGEIKNMGDTVVVNTIPDVYVGDYYRGKTRQWQLAKSDSVVMKVNRASDFAVARDDVDKKQFWDKNFLQVLAKDAMKKQKIKVDTDLLADVYADADSANKGATAGAKSGSYNLGATGAPIGLNKSNIIDYLHNNVECVADEQTWPDDERWIVIPTWMKGLLNVSDYKDESMTGMDSSLKGGKFGKIGKFAAHQSNLYTAVTDTGKACYPVLFGHKSAIAFVSQLSDVQYFDKLETTHGSGIAGLNIYDWKVIYGKALGVFYVYKA